jgi:tetratricopeptide (TPR) repeat protein
MGVRYRSVAACTRHCVCVAIWLTASSAAAHAGQAPPQAALDRAVSRMYNADFAGANAILDEEVGRHPDEALIYSVRAAAILFSEFNRLQILEFEFAADDDKVTDKHRLKPDPATRAELFGLLAEARKRSRARLAVQPQDRDAMFALCMATGIEADYVSLVEKKYIRTYSLSKEAQGYARKLLAMNPPFYDAYLTLGTAEYVVSNLNWFFRLFVRFDQIEGSTQKAVENLKKVIEKGRYYPPFARILLALVYVREKQPRQALELLQDMAREFPENPLVKNEVRRLTDQLARPAR